MNISRKKIAGMLLMLFMTTTAVMAQTEQNPVSDEEISKFAITFQKMRMMNQDVMRQLTEVVTREGMEVPRFNEIHQAEMDPAKTVEMTEEEQEKYKKIAAELEKMQLSFTKQMEGLISEAGLTPERYEEIATRLQTDPALQERLKAELQK